MKNISRDTDRQWIEVVSENGRRASIRVARLIVVGERQVLAGKRLPSSIRFIVFIVEKTV